jgi:hypothetical protein
VALGSVSAVFAQTNAKHSVPVCNFERGNYMTLDHDDGVELKFNVNWGTKKPFFVGGYF